MIHLKFCLIIVVLNIPIDIEKTRGDIDIFWFQYLSFHSSYWTIAYTSNISRIYPEGFTDSFWIGERYDICIKEYFGWYAFLL